MTDSTAKARIRLIQMEVRPGRPAQNSATMRRHIDQAKQDDVDIIVFPEMVIPGYLIGDEWERESFLKECEECGKDILQASNNITAVFGNVAIDWDARNEDGRVRKYNALFTVRDSVFIGPARSPFAYVIKSLLPNYREFDDSRHFYDVRKLALERNMPIEDLFAPVKAGNLSLGCMICEDAWDSDYALSPLKSLEKHAVDFFINISASPFTYNKNSKRNRVFTAHAGHTKKPFIYVNQTGIQNNGKTVFTFDGGSCIYDCHGNILNCATAYNEENLTFDLPLNSGTRFGRPITYTQDSIADIHKAIEYGTNNFMKLCGVSKVVVGLSGGIDSAVVACIYSRLLKPANLLLVNMPSRYNSTLTRDLARKLASNLKCLYAEIPIEDSVELTRRQLEGLEFASTNGSIKSKVQLDGRVMENIQARDRSSRILAAVAAAFGGVFTCNSNKTEATVGYTTLYGDLAGYFANIADLWKMEVYELGMYMNDKIFMSNMIPEGIFKVTPSAELSADQNVNEGKGDPLIYPYHDKLFASWVESWNRATPEDILQWYMDGSLELKIGYIDKVKDIFKDHQSFITDLERWWNLYQGLGLAKRIQAPPILAVKRRAFGFDHRESQIGARYTRKYQLLKKTLLEL